MQIWDSSFAARSKMFEPLQTVAEAVQGAAWPTPPLLNVLAVQREVRSGGGQPLQFVAPSGLPGAAGYELGIHDKGEAPLRAANWHDLFNALAWLAFPRTKAALNRAHAAELRAGAGGAGEQRNVRRDALTLFDESGVLVLSSESAVLDAIRAFEWKRVFWTERETLLKTTRFVVFGHALYEKALTPYVGMTGHALLLEMPPGAPGVEVADAAAAQAVQASIEQPRDLSPLPVLGVPGWWDANSAESFYDNTEYFRPGRLRSRQP
jgi:Protein of unknown function (DUF3025)